MTAIDVATGFVAIILRWTITGMSVPLATAERVSPEVDGLNRAKARAKAIFEEQYILMHTLKNSVQDNLPSSCSWSWKRAHEDGQQCFQPVQTP
ncbi:hypothetical protein, partial [Deinococcus sp. UYEF24]